MASKRRRLETVVTELQLRYGADAVRRYHSQSQPPKPACISTGFATLDRATGIGGIPRGYATELLGMPTSGMATLALHVLARAQAKGDLAIYVDSEHTLDPAYAAGCGVNLHTLYLIRPQTIAQGLAMLPELVASGGAGVLIYYVGLPPLDATQAPMVRGASVILRQLNAALHKSTAAMLFLTPLLAPDAPEAAIYPTGWTLPAVAALRLWLRRERWLHRRRDVIGYEAEVSVIGNKLAAPRRSARIRLAVGASNASAEL